MKKYLLWILLLVALAAGLGPISAGRLRLHSGGGVTATTFAHLPVGGGGFSSGIQCASDGTCVSRVDVFGTYVCSATPCTTGTPWTLLDTEQIMPAGSSPGGGIEIVVCDSNTNIIYKWMNDGKLYRSLNKGTSFVQLTGFGTHDAGGANGSDADGLISYNGRLNGRKMECDPANPDVLYVGHAGGVVLSNNASQGTGVTPTFAAVTGVTAATGGGPGYTFAFDANGGTTGGKTNILYVGSPGHGVFKMTTPGGSFSAVSSSPSTPTNMAVSPNGLLWVADGTNGYKCTTCSGTPSWTTYNSGTIGFGAWAVAVDPNHSSSSSTEHVIFISAGGTLAPTTNSGTAWTTGLTFTRSSATIPWLENTPEGYMATSLIAYNKATDVIWFAEGIGIWTAPGNVSANYTWTASTVGIEDLVTNSVVSCDTASNAAAGAAWDRALFPLRPGSTYPSNHGSSYDVAIGAGWSIDCSSDGTGTIIGYEKAAGLSANGISVDTEYAGISTDNGLTWAPLAINTNNVTVTLPHSGSAAAGTNVLSFSSLPAWVGPPMTVINTTHAGTVNAHGFVLSPGQITLDRPITGVGVSNNDNIKIGLSTSTVVFTKPTTSSTTSGSVLHFTSISGISIHPGMSVYDLDTVSAINTGGNGTQVLSVSGGDVTLTQAVTGTVASGDVIMFSDAAQGGAVAVSTSTNWCFTPSNDYAFPSCTQDGGQTYNIVDIAGVPRTLSGSTTNGSTTVTVSSTSNVVTGTGANISDCCGGPAVNGAACIPNNTTVSSITDSTHLVISQAATCTAANDIFNLEPGWSHAYYNSARPIAADRVTANKFYLYNYLTGKCYVSTDGGATWPNSYNTGLRSFGGTGAFYGMAMKAVPGNAGHLYFSAGGIDSQAAGFMYSTDGCQTWTAVSNVNTVGAFGFGKAKPGGSGDPTIFIYGKVSGVFSLWRSDDNASTWINLGTANPVALAGTGDIDGDKNVYGQFFAAGGSNGWYYGHLNFLLKRDLDPAANDNTPMFVNQAA